MRMHPSFKPIATEYDYRVKFAGTCKFKSPLQYLSLSPCILEEIVGEDEVLVVGVAEEERLLHLLEVCAEELVGAAIRELHHRILQTADALKHLIGHCSE